MNILIYAPQYRPNLSSIIRSTEFFGFNKIYIFDKNRLLLPKEESKKARAEMEHMARVWTAGAINFVDIKKIDNAEIFLKNYPGRKIVTVLDKSAEHLNKFNFNKEDLIIFGNEKDGFPESLIECIDKKIYIPSLGQTPCLNVAVTFGITIFHALNTLSEK